MKLAFPGTRGGITLRSPEHFMHSCLLVRHQTRAILIDCGEDWLGHLDRLADAKAVVITHGHPDHVGGLKQGWERPIWATQEAWQAMAAFPLRERNVLAPEVEVEIAGVAVKAVPVHHSLRAPAVGLRIRAGRATIFYVPDVLSVDDPVETLSDVDLYVGDGASLRRRVVQQTDGTLVGHTSVRMQLDWCAQAGVRKAVITHCGSPTVRNPEKALRVLRELREETGVQASFACDGMELVLRS